MKTLSDYLIELNSLDNTCEDEEAKKLAHQLFHQYKVHWFAMINFKKVIEKVYVKDNLLATTLKQVYLGLVHDLQLPSEVFDIEE